MSEVPLETLLEAMLFSAGRSLSVSEMSENLGYEEEEILESISNLQSTIKRRRGGGLQVVEIGGKWAMEVKPGIADHLPKETKSELPPKLLKAAALIAYHQPMPQSRLVELLGQRAYDHIREGSGRPNRAQKRWKYSQANYHSQIFRDVWLPSYRPQESQSMV